MGQTCSDDTEVSQDVEVTTRNDSITLQQSFEVQCDEKLMIYYKIYPELDITNILGAILSKIRFDCQCLLCPVGLWQLEFPPVYKFIYYMEIISRQRINELRQ